VNKKGEAWHRRHAANLMGYLPDSAEDALKVLEYARYFVESLLIPDREPEPPSGNAASTGGLRLMKAPIKLDAQSPPLAVIEPVEREPGDESH
jgi:hypothetical protein